MGIFAGALLHTQYGLIKRVLMKMIVVKRSGGDTDTSRHYVYTNWEGVVEFARAMGDTLPRAA